MDLSFSVTVWPFPKFKIKNFEWFWKLNKMLTGLKYKQFVILINHPKCYHYQFNFFFHCITMHGELLLFDLQNCIHSVWNKINAIWCFCLIIKQVVKLPQVCAFDELKGKAAEQRINNIYHFKMQTSENSSQSWVNVISNDKDVKVSLNHIWKVLERRFLLSIYKLRSQSILCERIGLKVAYIQSIYFLNWSDTS